MRGFEVNVMTGYFVHAGGRQILVAIGDHPEQQEDANYLAPSAKGNGEKPSPLLGLAVTEC
jgi:hypothetical protein